MMHHQEHGAFGVYIEVFSENRTNSQRELDKLPTIEGAKSDKLPTVEGKIGQTPNENWTNSQAGETRKSTYYFHK